MQSCRELEVLRCRSDSWTAVHGESACAGQPRIRYYAGAPLIVEIEPNSEPQKLGTLCVIDTAPRDPMEHEEREDLASLARWW